jgi:hypothetical protein
MALADRAGDDLALASGEIYLSDDNGIRRLDPDGTTVTLAGSRDSGFVDGVGCAARFYGAEGLALLGLPLFIADASNNRVRVLQLP